MKKAIGSKYLAMNELKMKQASAEKQVGPEVCLKCKTTYKDFNSLVDHSCHPYKCSICSAVFDYEYKLTMHENNIHTTPKLNGMENRKSSEWICTSCNLSFESSKSYVDHLSTCKQRRSCEICEKPLGPRSKHPYCPNCLSIIKDNRDYNLRFKTNGNISLNDLSHKSTIHYNSLANSVSVKNFSPPSIKETKVLDLQSKKVIVLRGPSHVDPPHFKESIKPNSQRFGKQKRVEYGTLENVSTNILSKPFLSGQIMKTHKSKKDISTNGIGISCSSIAKYNKFNALASPEKHSINGLDLPSASKSFDSTESKRKVLKKRTNEKKSIEPNRSGSPNNSVSKRKREVINEKRRPFENSRNSHSLNSQSVSQKCNLKTQNSSLEEQSKSSSSKKLKSIPSNSKVESDVVKLESLIDSLPDRNCGILLQSKSDSNFKCAKCNKIFRSSKLGSAHYSSCRLNRFRKVMVTISDIKWICVICHSHFNLISELIKHRKLCFDFIPKPGFSKENIIASVKKSIKDYKNACMNWCPKCNYMCISAILFQNHSCEKTLEHMRSCHVSVKRLPKLNTKTGEYLYECHLCKKVFLDDNVYSFHMKKHPNSHWNTNMKPVYLRPEVSDVEMIKAELLSDESFNECDESLMVGVQNSRQSSNVLSPLSDYILSQPLWNSPGSSSQINTAISPTLNSHCQLPVSVHPDDIPTSQSALSEDSNSPVPSEKENQELNKLCKCQEKAPTKNDEDIKPCLNCLLSYVLPMALEAQELAANNVKKEMPENNENESLSISAELGISECMSSPEELDLTSPGHGQSSRNLELGFNSSSLPVELIQSLNSALTPPLSHSGLTPPPTPDDIVIQSRVQSPSPVHILKTLSARPHLIADPSSSLLVKPPCSTSDTYVNVEKSVIPSTSDLPNESTEAEAEKQIAVQELIPIQHMWPAEHSGNFDAWAILSSKDSSIIEKYICPLCFGSFNEESLSNHLPSVHGLKPDVIVAEYMVKTNSPN